MTQTDASPAQRKGRPKAQRPKQEVVTIYHDPAPAPAPQSDTARALALIELVIADKDQPVERVEQAFALYQRVLDDADARAKREAEVAYAKALPLMQADLPIISKRGKGNNDARYARWEDIGPQIMPVLTKHGFSLEFPTKVGSGKIEMRCRLRHRDGHHEDSDVFEAPADTTGNKNAVQALGSSTTYAKRYTAGLKLNLIFEDESDDDGKASVTGFIDDDQIATLRDLVSATDTELADFFNFARVKVWSEIPATQYPRLRAMLLRKQKMRAQAAVEGVSNAGH